MSKALKLAYLTVGFALVLLIWLVLSSVDYLIFEYPELESNAKEFCEEYEFDFKSVWACESITDNTITIIKIDERNGKFYFIKEAEQK